ncbi:VOC family protein [Micromonospora sp. 15K316]|uniref:VOC family protein n=1 Tax=Micromonospora sp. 15K316 TaxID=2530376 RepID=UPI00105113A5|nr:VOC family protein [Micromonospora sp. 15K316]TDC35203.1 VOC family protein [Micromonospora sp. 15K316]
MTDIPPGAPAWIDLVTTDLDGAARFYAPLFGWAVADAGPQAGADDHLVFHQQGKPVAGAGLGAGPQQPPAWLPYLATDDVEEVCRRVTAAGGWILTEPVDVPGSRRTALFADPAGASFGVWQSLGMPGAEVFDVPGSLTWPELTTRESDGAREFYGSVFGWTADEQPMGPITYTTWQLDGRPVAGMMPMVGEDWGDLPSHWMVYFAVTDTDRVVAEAIRMGATLAVQPTDLTRGRFAVLTDPQGAFFSVLGTTPP